MKTRRQAKLDNKISKSIAENVSADPESTANHNIVNISQNQVTTQPQNGDVGGARKRSKYVEGMWFPSTHNFTPSLHILSNNCYFTKSISIDSDSLSEAKEEEKSENGKLSEKKSNDNNLQVAKIEPPARLTISDIIDNNRTGVPAKSEIEAKLKNKLRREKNKTESLKSVDQISENQSTGIQGICKASASSEPVIEQPVANPEAPKQAPMTKKIIFVNGKAQIDQSSLMIEENQIRKAEDDPRNFKIINEDSNAYNSKVIYGKHSHTKKWTPEETEFFYKCLEDCGTDFSMIESKFKGKRNRTQIKNKFRKEESENPSKVDQAVLKTLYNKREAKEVAISRERDRDCDDK